MNLQHHSVSWVNIGCVALALFGFLLSKSQVVLKCFKVELIEEDLDYEEMKLRDPNDYDLSNPATACKALHDERKEVAYKNRYLPVYKPENFQEELEHIKTHSKEQKEPKGIEKYF